MPKAVFYHYTTPEAAEEIIRSGLLIKSSQNGGGDANYGEGVYLTQLEPSSGKHVIALNNWDGGRGNAALHIRLGKVDACIRLELDTRKVKKAKSSGRDVFLWPGNLQITKGMNAEGYYID